MKNGIGRSVECVISRAADGSLAGAIHTFITPSCGAIQPSHWPSSLIVPPARVGFPNSASRGISGTSDTRSAAEGRVATSVIGGSPLLYYSYNTQLLRKRL